MVDALTLRNEDATPLRVLHVLNGATGGAAMSTRDLIEAMKRHGVESSVVCHTMGLPQDYERLREATAGRVLFTPLYWWNHKIRARWWRRPWLELKQSVLTGRGRRSAQIVADFAARQGADLIHTSSLTTPEGGLAAKLLGVPHVWHAREVVGRGSPYPLQLDGRELGDYLQEHAAYVIANSNATAERLRPWLPPDRLRVIPNGIAIERFAEAEPRTNPHPVVVGMVANYGRNKKHDLFIEAAALVDRNLDVEFRIYGNPPERANSLEPLIRKHQLQDRLRWVGFVADPVAAMNEIDVLLHPNDQEAFGRVIVEAMAAGRTIIAIRRAGAAEIVIDGETGLLAEPDSAPQLAAHVERLVRDAELRRKFGEAGRRRAAEHYDLRRCVAQIEQTYRDALRPLAAAPARVSEAAT